MSACYRYVHIYLLIIKIICYKSAEIETLRHQLESGFMINNNNVVSAYSLSI